MNEVGRPTRQGYKYSRLVDQNKFQKINGTHEIKYNASDADTYTIVLMQSQHILDSTHAER